MLSTVEAAGKQEEETDRGSDPFRVGFQEFLGFRGRCPRLSISDPFRDRQPKPPCAFKTKLADYGIKANLDREDYRKGLENLKRVW